MSDLAVIHEVLNRIAVAKEREAMLTEYVVLTDLYAKGLLPLKLIPRKRNLELTLWPDMKGAPMA